MEMFRQSRFDKIREIPRKILTYAFTKDRLEYISFNIVDFLFSNDDSGRQCSVLFENI